MEVRSWGGGPELGEGPELRWRSGVGVEEWRSGGVEEWIVFSGSVLGLAEDRD